MIKLPAVTAGIELSGDNATTEPDLRESRQIHEPPILFPGETELSFAVPDRLINPDKLTLAAEHTLRSKITKPNPEFGTVHTELEQLNIWVSPGNVNRALRIMDVLVKAWKRRGYRIGFEGRDMFVFKSPKLFSSITITFTLINVEMQLKFVKMYTTQTGINQIVKRFWVSQFLRVRSDSTNHSPQF